MQNKFSLLICLMLMILNILFITSIEANIIILIITLIQLLSSNITIKDIKELLFKIKYVFLLILLVPFNIYFLLILYKLLLIILLIYSYFKSTSICTRYIYLYNFLKIFKLNKYTINIIYFLPIFIDELKKYIKYCSVINIFNYTKNKLNKLKERFNYFDSLEINICYNDYILLIVTFVFTILVFIEEVL